MKKSLVLLAAGSACALLLAQSSMQFHLNSGLLDVFNISNEDTLRFVNGLVSVDGPSAKSYDVQDVDSVTFSFKEEPLGDTVFVRYAGSEVEIINPFAGVDVKTNGADVMVASAANQKGIVYCISGVSSNGSFTLTPDRGYTLCLDNLSLASSSSAPIVLNASANGENYTANVHLRGASVLTDAEGSAYKGALYTKSKLKIYEDSLYANSSLSITGNAKHALNSSKRVELYSGKLVVEGAASDGINADGLEVYGGELSISGTNGDGVDCSEFIRIAGGELNIAVQADDSKGLKCDSLIEISGGELSFNVSGAGSKAVKAAMDVNVSGASITAKLSAAAPFVNPDDPADYGYNALFAANNVLLSGDAKVKVGGNGIAARAINVRNSFVMDGGNMELDLTGAYSIETGAGDTTSVYGVKADTFISINGGVLTINIGEDANIAKGLKAKRVNIFGGEVSIVNKGGYWYTTSQSSSSQNNPWGGMGGWGGNRPGMGGMGGGSTSQVNANTPKAISADEIFIKAGKVDLTCLHGKAVSANNTIKVGDPDAVDVNNALSLTITAGLESDPSYNASNEKQHYLRYCGPKAIMCDNDVFVYGGNITISTFDTGIKGKNVTVDGGFLTISSPNDQGLHGVQNLTINGGDILVSESFEGFEGTNMTFNGGVTSVFSADDAWNCSNSSSGTGTPTLVVNGGVHYANVGSGDTDAIDSNGSMSFQGGVVIVESGNVSLDCDASPAYNSNATLMLFCKSTEAIPTGSTARAVSSISANTRYTAASNNQVLSSFTTTQTATQLIYISGTTPTFTSGGTYASGTDVVIRGKNNTTMTYSHGGSISGGNTLNSSAASAQGMGGGGGRW